LPGGYQTISFSFDDIRPVALDNKTNNPLDFPQNFSVALEATLLGLLFIFRKISSALGIISQYTNRQKGIIS
jgi:hypothetical protein